jgi:hypothetical protein
MGNPDKPCEAVDAGKGVGIRLVLKATSCRANLSPFPTLRVTCTQRDNASLWEKLLNYFNG